MSWKRPLIPLVIIILLMAFSWLRMQPADSQQLRRTQMIMGTVVEIVAYGEDRDQLQAAINNAFREMVRLEKLLSRHVQESDVTRLSQSETGDSVALETAEILTLGLDVARRSQGAFDMTLGQLKLLWGFDRETPSVPENKAVARAIQGIGPGALSLKKQFVHKSSPELLVDLGGIAKGYAVDRAIAVLKEHGISSGAVNAGGDMFLHGRHPERSWRIGIQHPREQGQTIATVHVEDKAVVTSGDYERYFERDGKRYHHIFDPKTGQPAQSCQSVTIIADSVALGDALATAIFVMGPEAGLKLLEIYPGSEGLIVAADGSLHSSPGWESLVAIP